MPKIALALPFLLSSLSLPSPPGSHDCSHMAAFLRHGAMSVSLHNTNPTLIHGSSLIWNSNVHCICWCQSLDYLTSNMCLLLIVCNRKSALPLLAHFLDSPHSQVPTQATGAAHEMPAHSRYDDRRNSHKDMTRNDQ